jgi:hypothetical protein
MTRTEYNKKVESLALDLRRACFKLEIYKVGQIQHTLRCKYGQNYKQISRLSGMMPEEFDELLQASECDSELNSYGY